MPDVIISPIHVRLLVFNALRSTATIRRREKPDARSFSEDNVVLGLAMEGAAADNGTLRG